MITDRSLLKATSINSSGNTKSSTNNNSGTANSNTNIDTEVGSGQISFHIVQMLPTEQSFLTPGSPNNTLLKGFQYDVSKINQA